MTSFLIALVFSICGIASGDANSMSEQALYNELYEVGYTQEELQRQAAEQQQEEYGEETAPGSGIDLE